MVRRVYQCKRFAASGGLVEIEAQLIQFYSETRLFHEEIARIDRRRLHTFFMIQKTIFFHLFLILFVSAGSALAGEQTILRLKRYQVPVLAMKENNPVLQINLIPQGQEGGIVTAVRLSLDERTNAKDIRAVRIFYSQTSETFTAKTRFGTDQAPASEMLFKDRVAYREPVVFWVSVQLNDAIDLTGLVGITVAEVITEAGPLSIDDSAAQDPLRVGIALRKHRDDDVHTYRIPGLDVTNEGTLLAVYDVRRDSARDLQGNIDIGLSRSADGGRTWEPMRIILDMKKWGGLPEKYNGVSDPQILVDRRTNTIFVSALWMHGVLDKDGRWIEGLDEDSDAWEHQWRRRGSQPGFDVRETSQFLMTKSTDDGKTWSEPINLTEAAKRPEWWLWAPAPGHGITLDDGTLVMPTQGRDKNGKAFSNITWSRDGGNTWVTSNPAYHNTTECNAVQLSDGSIMLNMRHNANRGNTINNGRAVAVTTDLGETWEEHPTSRTALIEPTCMASLHKHEYSDGNVAKSLLLFANPNSASTRDHITIKVSRDDGKTWPEENWLLLDEWKGRGYSSITSIGEDAIGIVYEGSQADLTFQKILLSDLIGSGVR